jgi:hypothetical protein
MRTKTLLCAAALAAGVVSSMAQSNVYSLNVVGYVNVATKGGGGFNFVGNPLNNTGSNGNNITNLFANAQDGDQIYTWNRITQDLDGTIYTYSAFLHAWDGNLPLPPGIGIFYFNAGNDATNTFVGEVIQGAYVNPLPSPSILGGGAFNSISSSAPLGGSFTNSIVGIPPQDGDQVYTWNTTTQDLDGNIATYSSFLGKWDNTSIQVAAGGALFYFGAGNNLPTWTRNFTVQ